MAKSLVSDKEEPLEKQLWKTADTLRKNIDAAEYKHIVLGLIFLKYISDAFEELYAQLKAEYADGTDPEDKDEYAGENIFFVPPTARWSFLRDKAKLPDICKIVEDAMDVIEKENTSLRGVWLKWTSPSLRGGNYQDIAGFCAAVHIDKVRELDYVLTPGRYVGLPDDEDDFDFNTRFTTLKAELEAQLVEETALNQAIMENLSKVVLNTEGV